MEGFIIDLDGTIYQGNQLIDGAKQFVEALQEQDIPHLFVTNNSLLTPEKIAAKIRKMGIPVHVENIFTSSMAAAAYLKNQNVNYKVSLIGGEGLQEAISVAGFEITDERPNVVIQGVDPHFSYEKLHQGIHHLRQGAEYILTNPDKLIPVENGFLPGAGTISAALQAGSQTTPLIIGKPSPIIMQFAIDKLGIEPQKICVVGDNLLTDIQAGSAVGCYTAWVMTGIAPQQKANRLEITNLQPDIICQNLNELLEMVEKGQSSTTLT